MLFLSLVTLTFDLDLQTRPSEGLTRLPCEFGANQFSGSRDISHTASDNISSVRAKMPELYIG